MSGTENILANASVVGEELELVGLGLGFCSLGAQFVGYSACSGTRCLQGGGACADATISLSGTFEL